MKGTDEMCIRDNIIGACVNVCLCLFVYRLKSAFDMTGTSMRQ